MVASSAGSREEVYINEVTRHFKASGLFRYYINNMGKFFDEIPQHIIPWIKKQKMFWVATAPLSENGHVNVSPKGFEGTFHIVDRSKVWYEDMSGSGMFSFMCRAI